LRALELGAADHMVAPFALGEGIARIESLLVRRIAQRGLLQLADITLDPGQRIAIRGNTAIPLTPRELDVLALLMRNRGRVTSKQELIDQIWTGKQASPNAVEAAISSLRRKLHRPGHEIIRTVHRAGYTLQVPMTSPANRGAMIAERDRLLRERDDAIARRDKVIRRLRDEIDVAAGQTRQLERRSRVENPDDGRNPPR
jgi:DNA-binding winged helix-turn-helix (wHTH) protein